MPIRLHHTEVAFFCENLGEIVGRSVGAGCGAPQADFAVFFAAFRGFFVNQSTNGVAGSEIDAGGSAGTDHDETFFGGKRVARNRLRRDNYRTECWDACSSEPEEGHYSSDSLSAPGKCGRSSPRQFDMC
jgi:hypothetical protein